MNSYSARQNCNPISKIISTLKPSSKQSPTHPEPSSQLVLVSVSQSTKSTDQDSTVHGEDHNVMVLHFEPLYISFLSSLAWPMLINQALITYSNYLIKNGQSKKAKEIIWPIISNDLSYVGQYWNSTGFDLWEEVQGSSFFTVQNQHRALAEGAQLAKSLRVTCTGCDQAPEVLCFLQSFWNGKYIVSNINVNNGRTGLDGNSILGPIAVFDIDAYVCPLSLILQDVKTISY